MLVAIFKPLKCGPKVVLAGSCMQQNWLHHSVFRPRFCIDGLLEFFVYLLPFNIYSIVMIWLEIWHSGGKILGILPRNVISYQRDPQKALLQQTASFEPSCEQIGLAIWSAEAYKKKRWGIVKKIWGYISPICGAAPANRFELFQHIV
jgi:hypothetical protein